MKRELFLIIACFVLVSLVFFHPVLKGFIAFPGDLLVGNYAPYSSYPNLGYSPGGVPHKAQGADIVKQLFVWKNFVIEQFKQGQVPLWNSYNMSGNPLMANLQSGVFYPINLIFMILPFLFAWNIYIILQPILAGFFTYLFLREIKISRSASFFGGIAFAFSAFMTVWIEYGNLGHAILWLPLALFLILRYFEKPNITYLILLTLTLSLSIFAGHIQLTIYLFFFSFIFVIANFLKEKNKLKNFEIYINICVPFFISTMLGMIQLLPTVEIFRQSARHPYTFNQLSERLIPLINVVTTIIPDFFGNPASRNYWLFGTYIERVSYIGVIPFLFAAFSVFSKKSFYKIFFIIVAIMTYLTTLDVYPIKLFHSLGIPILSTTVPSRVLVIYSFSVSVLAAIGFDSWQKITDVKKYFKVFLIFIFIFILFWILILIIPNPNFSISKRNLFLPTLFLSFGGFLIFADIFLVKIFKNKIFNYKKIISAILIFLVVLDLYYFFQKITPFAPVEFIYPKTKVFDKLKEIQGINRSWGYGGAFIEPNFHTLEKIFSTDGYEPLFIKNYGELLSVSKDGFIPNTIKRADVNVQQGFGWEDIRNNLYRQRILNLLGVKYLLIRKGEVLPPDIYKMIWEDKAYQIYENKQVIPRVFLSSSYVVENSPAKIIEKIYDKNFDPTKTLILEDEISPKINLWEDAKAKVEIKSYTPDKVILKTSSSANMLLFLSDNYFPGWRVSIDGENNKIYKADYTFRAVPVKKGEHEIVFWYYPKMFDLGLKISLIAFFALLFAILTKLRKVA